MDKLFGPDGRAIGAPAPQDLARAQAAALQHELEVGRLAMRVLALLVGEMPKKRAMIRPARWARFREKNAGSAVRFIRRDDGGVEVRLSTAQETADAMSAPAKAKEADGDVPNP